MIEQSQRESERHRLIRRTSQTQRQRSQLTDEQREVEFTLLMNKRFQYNNYIIINVQYSLTFIITFHSLSNDFKD